MSTSGIARRFRDAEIPLRAAALAYHTLIGIVPSVGLVFWYLRRIGVTKQWRTLLHQFFVSHLNMEASDAFQQNFDALTRAVQTRTSSMIGLAVLLLTSFNLVTKLGNSLDEIVHTQSSRPRLDASYAWLMLRRTLVIVCLPLAITLSVVAASWVQKDSWMRFLFQVESVGPYLARPIPLLIDIFALFTLYQFIPRHPAGWKESLRAAVLAGPVFAGVKWAVGFYNKYALVTLKFYGALAAVMIFLVWIQFAWIIVLSGALLVRTPLDPQRSPDEPPSHG